MQLSSSKLSKRIKHHFPCLYYHSDEMSATIVTNHINHGNFTKEDDKSFLVHTDGQNKVKYQRDLQFRQ